LRHIHDPCDVRTTVTDENAYSDFIITHDIFLT
jgi:hypothetical protein